MSKAYADKALEEAFERYGRALEEFCRVRLGEAGQNSNDCVQEAFLVFYKRLLGGEAFENPRAFLYKTANNMVLRAKEEYFKNAKRSKSLEEAEDVPVFLEAFSEKEIDYDEIKEILISQLSEEEQKLYKMKYEREMSLAEIGKELSIAPAAAANRLSRLRNKIKAMTKPFLQEKLKGGG